MQEETKLFGASTTLTPDIYKNFYKTYYAEKLRVFNIFALIAAILLVIAAAFLYFNNFGLLWPFLALWAAAFLLVYPRILYKKPYKRSKDAAQVTHFAFYDTYMTEKTASRKTEYKYTDIEKVIQTKKCFFLFHGGDKVSIVSRENVDGSDEELASLLRRRTNKYRTIKKG